MLAGLLIGTLAIAVAIGSTRWQCARLRSDPNRARALELTLWAVYLFLAALIYVGLSLREAGDGWRTIELAGLVAYSGFALVGARGRTVVLALGWALHAAWDLVVHHGAPEQLVPQWYRWACLVFDFGAAAYLLRRGRPRAKGTTP